MEKKSLLLQLSILIIVLLGAGLAALRWSGEEGVSHSYNKARTSSGYAQQPPTREPSFENLKKQEMLGLAPSSPRTGTRYVRTPDGRLVPAGPRSSIAATPSADMSLPSGRPYALGGRHGASVGNLPQNSFNPKGLSNINYNKYGSSSAGTSAGRTVAGGEGAARAAGVYQPTVAEQQARELAPYMASLTNKDRAQKLQQQLNAVTLGVERALAKALLPKSKKDANIEKYLNRNASPQAIAAGPFAGVIQQVAAQRAGVVSSMGNAFGKEAAKEAGQVMSDYQNELSSALTQPGQTQEQLAQKTREISQKYNDKLQKVSEKHGFQQFYAERVAKDNQLKEELSKHYGPEIVAAAGAKIDAAREKDMLLARQGLPAEEYYNQQLANQQSRRKEIEAVITGAGKSTRGLLEAENQLEQDEVARALEAEESGQKQVRVYRASEEELTAIGTSLSQERQEKVQAAGSLYGAEGAQRMDAVYQRYYQEYMRIWNDPETSRTEKQQASMNLRQEVNNEIDQIQRDPSLQQARVTRQVDAQMSQIMDSMSGASPEQKDAVEQRARPILTEMYERANEIQNSNLPEDEKQRRLQRVQEDAQRQLSAI